MSVWQSCYVTLCRYKRSRLLPFSLNFLVTNKLLFFDKIVFIIVLVLCDDDLELSG